MNILSGEELRVSRFVAEYSRVFRRSAVGLFKQMARQPMRGPARLTSLAKTSFGRVGQAVERTARKVVERYRLELHELPQRGPRPMTPSTPTAHKSASLVPVMSLKRTPASLRYTVCHVLCAHRRTRPSD